MTAKQTNFDPNQKYRAKYLCFIPNHPVEDAIETFRHKYSQHPSEKFYEKGLLWVGPIPGSANYRLEPDQVTIESLGNIGIKSAWQQLEFFK